MTEQPHRRAERSLVQVPDSLPVVAELSKLGLELATVPTNHDAYQRDPDVW